MALGLNWEWRGFGPVPSGFAHRFSKLASLFDPQDVEDVYLWVSGLEVNVKVRDIPEEPFKFKRLQDKDGHFPYNLNCTILPTLCDGIGA